MRKILRRIQRCVFHREWSKLRKCPFSMDDMKRELHQSSIDIPVDGLELEACWTKEDYVIDLWLAFRAQWCIKCCSASSYMGEWLWIFPTLGIFPRMCTVTGKESFVSIALEHDLFSEPIFSLFCDQFWRFMCHSKAKKITFYFVTDS